MTEDIISYLYSAFNGGHGLHAYIVEGERFELTQLLRSCAKVALCPNHANDGCDVCKKVTNGSHQDVISLPLDKNKNKLTVEDINYMVEESVKRPVDSGNCRVFTIDASNSVTGVGSAVWQNKLLKTLEEPLDGVHIFIGVTDSESLLATVRSRCQVLRCGKLSFAEVTKELTNRGYLLRSAQMASVMSGGNIDNAEKFMMSVASFEAFELAVNVALNMTSTKNALKYVSEIIAHKDNVGDFLGFYSELLFDSVTYRVSPELFKLTTLEKEIRQICNGYSIPAVIAIIELINDAKAKLDNGGNISVVIDNLAVSILEVKYRCRI